MFLNFSMWNIKTSKYFLNFLPGWPVLTRVNPYDLDPAPWSGQPSS